MTQTKQPVTIELLAPAKDAATAFAAIDHGADAVYIGAPSHGARSAASVETDDIRRVTEYAHRFGARVYVTVNTIVLEDETDAVERMIRDLYRAGADALIVQDMGLLRMKLPPIALHASTQCDIRTPDKARFLADAGFSQLVVARELSVKEMSEIHRVVPDTPLEAFVHGALCVSYSGDCQAGYVLQGRSANRGECPQICRLPFDLVDGRGQTVIKGKHLLSLRDLNRSASLLEMLEAGISSFKIEGRLKDASYVKNVTAAYSRMLDDLIAQNPGRWQRRSYGRSELKFTPSLDNSFNRGFTSYFTHGRPADNALRMASIDTPKWCGKPVGKVLSVKGNRLKTQLTDKLANGDGLGYFDPQRRFCGFRANRVDGNTIVLTAPLHIATGTTLYRNRDKRLTDIMDGETATRRIGLTMTLRSLPDKRLALELNDDRGCSVTAVSDATFEEHARTPQSARRAATLGKTGDTIYNVTAIDDLCDDLFIPVTMLAELRRTAISQLDNAWKATYKYDYRRAEKIGAKPETATLTYHDNVANSLARKFYTDHSVNSMESALESRPALDRDKELKVMTTRYCLRRELGACLRSPGGRRLAGPLKLIGGNRELRVEFDCANCRMQIFAKPK